MVSQALDNITSNEVFFIRILVVIQTKKTKQETILNIVFFFLVKQKSIQNM